MPSGPRSDCPRSGWVRYRDTRPLAGTLNNVTINLTPSGWHIRFNLASEHDAPATPLPAQVGIDCGVAETLALSTGKMLTLPSSLAVLDRKKRKAQRVLARRKRGSVRYAKQRRRVAAIQGRQGRIRKDWHHRVTRDLGNRFGIVVLEQLDIKSMTASAKGTLANPGHMVRQKAGLNRSILNQGWHIFETLLGSVDIHIVIKTEDWLSQTSRSMELSLLFRLNRTEKYNETMIHTCTKGDIVLKITS